MTRRAQPRTRADHPYPPVQHDGDRADRRGGDRRLARVRGQPQFLARPAPRHSACRAGRWPQAGVVHALVYRDLNDNGVHDAAEPFEKGALITTGTQQAERPTDAKGAVTIGGLTAFTPVAVGIDATSLDDPMLVPKKALQVVVPRPGVAGRRRNRPGRRGRHRRRAGQERRARFSKDSTSSWSMAAGKVVATARTRLRRLLPVRARALWQLCDPSYRRNRRWRRRSPRSSGSRRPSRRSGAWPGLARST